MRSREDYELQAALVKQGLLNDVQLKVVHDYQRSVGGTLKDVLVRLDFFTEEEVERLSSENRVSKVTAQVVDRSLMEKLPEKLLLGYRVVPIISEKGTVLASEIELEPIIRDELWSLLGMQLPVVKVEPDSVKKVLESLITQKHEGKNTGRNEEASSLASLTVEDLCRILLSKGVISEEDLHPSPIDSKKAGRSSQ